MRFVIVNSFTGLNLFLGLLSLLALTTGSLSLAAWCLLLCVFLDGCDGSLARRWHVATDFGAQLDSLADMTSFIVAGGALAYHWIVPTETPIPLIVIIGVSGIYVLAGAIRLARYNTTVSAPGYFQGLPTTIVAGVVAANYLVQPAMNSYWIIALVTLLAVLMVSILPYPRISELRRLPPFLLLFVLLGLAFQPSWTIWTLTIAYLCLGPAIWAYRRYTALAR
jgi:CDP-diacylglycerol--serine O-phosphatidyltransferase